MAYTGRHKVTCPVCEEQQVGHLNPWDSRITIRCCGGTVTSTVDGLMTKISFRVGKFTVTGTRERVRVDIGRHNHQIIQTDIRNFISIQESTLETIYISGKWNMIEKGLSMR